MAECRSKPEITEFFLSMTDFGREQEEESRCFDNFSIPGFPDQPTSKRRSRTDKSLTQTQSVNDLATGWWQNWSKLELGQIFDF